MKKEHGLITLAAILYGTIVVGGQFFVRLGLSLFEIALFSMTLLTICILPVLLFKSEYLISVRSLPFFLVYGLIGAGVNLAQIAGLFFGVPVAVVAFLLYTQPLWTVFLGRMILRESITYRKMVATGLSIAGTAGLLHTAWTDTEGISVVGLFAAVCGGIFLSLWVIWGRKSGISNLHFVTTTAGLGFFTALWLILLWLPASLLVRDPAIVRLSVSFPLVIWAYLIIFTLISALIPSFCFFRGIRMISAGVAGIILLLEPISASLLAWGFFGQRLGIVTVFGGGLILLSNYLVVTEGAPPPASCLNRGRHELL
jgi:DME family drug/metabolite transporter